MPIPKMTFQVPYGHFHEKSSKIGRVDQLQRPISTLFRDVLPNFKSVSYRAEPELHSRRKIRENFLVPLERKTRKTEISLFKIQKKIFQNIFLNFFSVIFRFQGMLYNLVQVKTKTPEYSKISKKALPTLIIRDFFALKIVLK